MPELLATLRGRGVLVAREGDALKLDAPKGALSDLLPELQKFKPSLLELLEEEKARGDVQALRVRQTRARLDRLEAALGEAGACRAIVVTARRLKRQKPDFWAKMNASDRHELALCVALLEAHK